MARNGARGFEYQDTSLRAVRLRVAQEKDRRERMAGVAQEIERLKAPSNPDLLPLPNIGAKMQIDDEFISGRINAINCGMIPLADLPEFPRILCRKSGMELGRVSETAWRQMLAVWPSLTTNAAELMLAECGNIAPHFIFSMPRAWRVLIGVAPQQTVILALEHTLRARWDNAAKSAMLARIFEGETDDSEGLELIAFELCFDLIRINRNWIALGKSAGFIEKIIFCNGLADLIETLKDCCHYVARETIGQFTGKNDAERLAEILARHGVKASQQQKPVMGEVQLIRRVIGAYYKDFSHIAKTLSGDELRALVGNARRFELEAMGRYSRNNHALPPALARLKQEQFAHDMLNSLLNTDLSAIEPHFTQPEPRAPIQQTTRNRAHELLAKFGKKPQE